MFKILQTFSQGAVLFLSFILILIVPNSAAAQKFSKLERDSAKEMLKTVKNDLKKNYYDLNFHGKDLDAHFKQAENEIDRANSLGEAVNVIAQAVLDLDDSHTIFLPPSHASKIEYGWQMQMIGNKCFVIAVKPESDAEAKGLKPGDEIVTIDGFHPTRSDLFTMRYFYYSLSPRAGVELVVKSPDDKQTRKLEIAAKVKTLKRFVDLTSSTDVYDLIREAQNENELREHRFRKINDVVIWKMPDFVFLPEQADSLIRSKTDSSKSSLVLDLRGNPGGYVVTLERIVEYLFDRDITIANRKGRKEDKPLKAKTKGGDVLKGKIVVLIDHGSSSAAEILARIVQLEKRGVVIGDVSAGAVMESRSYTEKLGVDRVMFYGLSISESDVIMPDGKSLEKVGVKPDELMLLTGADIASQRDPVLARAIEIAGAKVTPEEAGKFFSIKWIE